MEFVTSTLQTPFFMVFCQKVRSPEHRRSKAVLAKQSDLLNAALAIVESRLSNFEWLNGNELSTAEIAMGPVMHRIFDVDWGRKDIRAVQRWLERLQNRPVHRDCVMKSYEELRE